VLVCSAEDIGVVRTWNCKRHLREHKHPCFSAFVGLGCQVQDGMPWQRSKHT